MKRAHRTKRADDPLVPVQGDRVRAAIENRRVSEREAAKALGVHQATLNAIVTKQPGEVRRCRRSLRTKLAAYTGLPEEWLAGETATLSGTARTVPIPEVGTRKLASPPLLLRSEVAIQRVSRACLTRLESEMRSGKAPAPEGFPILRRAWGSETTRAIAVLTAIHDLLSPSAWRASLTPPRPDGSPPATSTEDAESITVGLADALYATVAPWLNGKAPLNYQQFYGLLENAGRHKGWSALAVSKSKGGH